MYVTSETETEGARFKLNEDHDGKLHVFLFKCDLMR